MAVNVEKEVFLSKESDAGEEIVGEIVNEEEIALENKVSLRKEGEEVILREKESVVVVVRLFQGEGSCQDAGAS